MKNSQKGFIVPVLLVIIAVLVVGGGVYIYKNKKVEVPAVVDNGTQQTNTQTPAPTPKPTISSSEVKKENGKMVLYKVYSDGTSQKTGLEVTLVKAGTYEVPVKIVVSPDKTKAVFNKWNNTTLKTEIYVSNIDGTNTKLLTQQEVGEGSGGLNQDSLVWSSDSKYITYFESQIACEAGCAPGSVISYKVTYQVNLATGEKKVISKVPLQYEPSVNVTSTLLIIQATGGLCPHGGCSSKITIKKDGTFTQEEGDGKIKSGNLGVNAVKNLQTLIESSNYSSLRSTPFTEMCPTAYDGSELTYKFQTSHGEEIISSCQTKIDSSSPLFKEVQNILNTIYSYN